MRRNSTEAQGPLEARLREGMNERGPLEWAGVTLAPGEWTDITAEQAQALAMVPGVQIREKKDHG